MKLISFLAGALLLTLPVFAQKATLRGQVTDETGAIVLGAQVTLSEPAAGLSKTSTVDSNGSYSFSDVPLGNYTLQASAPDLALRQPAQISLKAGVQNLNLVLSVVTVKQQIAVEEDSSPTINTDAGSNASATVIRGADLDALSDNPNDLADDLQAIGGTCCRTKGGLHRWIQWWPVATEERDSRDSPLSRVGRETRTPILGVMG